jgi:group I intron endonuclease
MMKGKLMICQNEIITLPSVNLENKIETDPNVSTNETRNELENKTSNGITKRKVSGIYKIINKVNGKYYVGSSKNIHKRWNEHRSDLNNKKHANEYLQKSWNKHGPNNFNFVIMECIKEEKLIEIEQKYLDELKNEKRCYNLTFIAGRTEMTDRVKLKLSIAHTGMKASEETKRKMSESMTGKNNHMFGKHRSKNTKKKISDSHLRKNYTLLSPDNKIIKTQNLKGFCKENKLNDGNMYGVYNGRYKQYRGWRFL